MADTGINDPVSLVQQSMSGGSGGGVDWASILQGGAGLYDIFNVVSGKNNQNTQEQINLAYPNAKYGGQYADMLNKALTDPGSYSMTPGAKFAEQQGLDAVASHGNAMFGSTRSGNTAIGLEKYATGFAAQNYDNYITQLTKLSQGSPDAAKLLQQGKGQGDQGIANGISGIGDLITWATSGAGGTAINAILKKLGLGGDGGSGGPGSPGWGSDITGPDGTNASGPDFNLGGGTSDAPGIDFGGGGGGPGDTSGDISGLFGGDLFGGL